MYRFGPLILLSMFCATPPLVTGCSESRAPAMTQVSRSPADQTAAVEPPTDAPDGRDAVSTAEAPTSDAADGALPAADQNPAPVETPERVRDISFDDLKFDINKGDPFKRSLLTDKIEALDGKPIRIRGFILPSFQQTGLTQFVLVRDNLSCCFGPGAAIYDCVIVEMKPGRATDYSLYPVAVEGTFAIREMLDPDGKTVAIYHLDGEQVR